MELDWPGHLLTTPGSAIRLCVLSSFAIILKRKREQVALLLLSYGCIDTVNILGLFLTVPLVCCGIS